jgi:hypothetical protein
MDSFEVGDQPVPMGAQCDVEFRGFVVGQGDLPGGGLLIGGLGERASRLGPWFGFRFEFDRSAQLTDGGRFDHLRVVGIGSVGGFFGDDPDLIH